MGCINTVTEDERSNEGTQRHVVLYTCSVSVLFNDSSSFTFQELLLVLKSDKMTKSVLVLAVMVPVSFGT